MLYEEKEKIVPKSHNIIMEDRAHLSVSGVLDVESFDERQIIARTPTGNLIIRGGDLHIDKLRQHRTKPGCCITYEYGKIGT